MLHATVMMPMTRFRINSGDASLAGMVVALI